MMRFEDFELVEATTRPNADVLLKHWYVALGSDFNQRQVCAITV